MCLRSDDPPAATLALVVAVALFDTVAIWTADILLKWPNDLLAGACGAKLAGVLLERAADRVVIGVGVNLVHCPDDLDRPVTSLSAMDIASPGTQLFVETLSQFFADWLERWRDEGLPAIRLAWLERAYPLGTALQVNLPDGDAIAGLFDGLTDDCALRLRLADGHARVIHAGDVFLI